VSKLVIFLFYGGLFIYFFEGILSAVRNEDLVLHLVLAPHFRLVRKENGTLLLYLFHRTKSTKHFFFVRNFIIFVTTYVNLSILYI
jgi:hypothetical protein